MNMLERPCLPDCPDRGPHCHSAKCPHGWADYEEACRREREKRAMGYGTGRRAPFTAGKAAVIRNKLMENKRRSRHG